MNFSHSLNQAKKPKKKSKSEKNQYNKYRNKKNKPFSSLYSFGFGFEINSSEINEFPSSVEVIFLKNIKSVAVCGSTNIVIKRGFLFFTNYNKRVNIVVVGEVGLR